MEGIINDNKIDNNKIIEINENINNKYNELKNKLIIMNIIIK